jgi:hypothetical protein
MNGLSGRLGVSGIAAKRIHSLCAIESRRTGEEDFGLKKLFARLCSSEFGSHC